MYTVKQDAQLVMEQSFPEITMTIHEDVSTQDLARMFYNFMLAAGHHPDNVKQCFSEELIDG